jgi:DNA mismatch repair protein MutS
MCFATTKTRCAHILLLALYTLAHQPLFCAEPEQDQPATPSSYEKLAQAYLPSLIKEAQAEKLQELERQQRNAQHIADLTKKAKGKKISLKTSDLSLATLGEVEKLEIIYNLLQQQAQPSPTLSNNVLHDLELFCGGPSDPKNNIFGVLDATTTAFGKIELQRMLLEPTTDIAELKNRQDIIKTLIKNPDLFKKIDLYLQQIKASENELLWFWKQMDETTEQFLNQVYCGKTLGINFSGFNTSSTATNAAAMWKEVGSPLWWSVGLPLSLLATTNVLTIFLIKKIDPDCAAPSQNATAATQSPSFLTKSLRQLYANKSTAILVTIIATLSLAHPAAAYLMGIKGCVSSARHFNTISNIIHAKMIKTASYFDATGELIKIMSTDTALNKILVDTTAQAKARSSEQEAQLKELLRLMETSTLHSNPSFFSLKGRPLAAFKLMHSTKNEFAGVLQLAGKLDAYLSLAKLYCSNPWGRYCFVDYVTNSATPYIKIDDFWHPMLNPNKVVANSIELGATSGAHNAVITGPNAGGKSTALKSIVLAIVMAQTLGIAPARAMSMTPFTQIGTYLNIADAIGKESLYQAEMNRAHALLKSIRSLKPGEFSFVIMDEIFTGTNPEEGSAGAFGIAKCLSSLPQSICLIATHYKQLTELEKATNGVFKNSKVSVVIEPNGDIVPTYRLENGIADQKIALLLLEKAGFDQDILQAAKEALNSQKSLPAA